MISRIFIAHNLIAYCLAVWVFFNRDFGVDIYQLIENYADNVPFFGYNIVLMVACFIIGGMFYKNIFPAHRAVSVSISAVKILPKANIRLSYGTLFILIVINLILMYGVLGNDFLSRDSYHDLLGDNAALMLISKFSIFVSIMVTYGYLRIYSLIRWISVVFLVVLSLNYSSVMSSGYVLGLLAYDILVLNKRGVFRITVYLILTFIVMMCATYFRGMNNHGIFNYLTDFDLDDFVDISQFALYYIWPFSTYVSIATESLYKPSIDSTLIMLNPLPGGVAGWPKISETMVVQFNVPYSTMGMVFATGLWFTIGFYMVFGFIFAYFDKTITQLFQMQRKLIAIGIVALGCYIIILHGAWELRSTMRILYYCSFVAMMANYTIARQGLINR